MKKWLLGIAITIFVAGIIGVAPVWAADTVYVDAVATPSGDTYDNLWNAIEGVDAGGKVILNSDVTGNALGSITKAFELELNGHTITAPNCYNYFEIGAGGNLTIVDSSTDQRGLVKLGNGCVGRCIEVCNGGKCTLKSGTISGFTHGSWNGGAVNINDVNSQFDMFGGTITGCTSTSNGGAICNAGTFNMYAGTIENCSSQLNGGAVYNNGVFNMTGGTITGCTAGDKGGGVYKNGSSSSVNVGGSARIIGNTVSGAKDDLYLPVDHFVGVSTPSNMKIGINMETPGTFTNNNLNGYKSYFFSDIDGYVVRYTDDYALRLVQGTDEPDDPVDPVRPVRTENVQGEFPWFLYFLKEKPAPKKEPAVLIDRDTYKSCLPSKTVMSGSVTDPKQIFEHKVHEMSKEDTANQELLVSHYAGLNGKRAKIIANYGIFPNRDLAASENGLLQILTWKDLEIKTPCVVYAVCYNETDGAYVISGTIDEFGTATLANYKLRPATNITLYVEY